MSSTQWAISGGGSLGGGVVAGVQALALTLIDISAQVRYGIFFVGAGLVAGLKAGLTISTESPYFFLTTSPQDASDFSGGATFKVVEFTPGIGGAEAFISFWGIDHSPEPLDIGGLDIGVAEGAGYFWGKIFVGDGTPLTSPIYPP
jgi:hypothetical protein